MDVAWYGHYAKYLEIARSALMETIDYGYEEMKKLGYLWPIVERKLRYVQPVRQRQRIKVTAKLREFELRLVVDFLSTDAETGERLSKGHTVQVPVGLETGEMRLGVPPVLYRKLSVEP